MYPRLQQLIARDQALWQHEDAQAHHDLLRDFQAFKQDFAAREKLDSTLSPPLLALLSDIMAYDNALACAHFNIMDLNNRAVRLSDLGFYFLAKQDYAKGIEIIRANFGEIAELDVFKFGLSTLFLRKQDFNQGWAFYESRPELKPLLNHYADARRWQGEELRGKTLLILHEQGIGDAFQFIRYAILLKEMGVDVVVNLAEITHDFLAFQLKKHGIRVVKKEGEAVLFDYYCSMMSLPFLLKTTKENVPFPSAYLHANPRYQPDFLTQLDSQKYHIGVVWHSGSGHLNQAKRNVDFAPFSALFQHADCQFHCLQKELSAHDVKLAQTHANLTLYADKIQDFFDTAALIAKMDLVITIDTAVAHLSAAMGKPTWILLSYKPDFRWGLASEKSMWYETARLFRQVLDQSWTPVIERVSAALDSFKQALKCENR